MAKTREQFRAEIRSLIRDGAGVLSPPDYERLIDRALEAYSRKKPREVVLDVASDGSGDQAVSALTGFDEEFSGDPQIEYPISTSGEPEYVDRRDWSFYRKPSGLVIRFANAIASGAQVRYAYKAPHAITEEAATLPDSDFFAFCKLAAAEGCTELAQHYTQTSEGQIIQTDVAIFQSKARDYATRGRDYRKEANEHFGIRDESSVPAASVTMN